MANLRSSFRTAWRSFSASATTTYQQRQRTWLQNRSSFKPETHLSTTLFKKNNNTTCIHFEPDSQSAVAGPTLLRTFSVSSFHQQGRESRFQRDTPDHVLRRIRDGVDYMGQKTKIDTHSHLYTQGSSRSRPSRRQEECRVPNATTRAEGEAGRDPMQVRLLQQADQAKEVSRRIRQLGKKGRIQEAVQLFESVAEIHRSSRLLTAILTAAGDAKRPKVGLKIFEEIRQMGPNMHTRILNQFVYSAVISLYGKDNQISKALSLLQEIAQKGMRPDVVTYNICINACKEAGKWEWVSEILESMQYNNVTPDVITFSACISACAKGGLWDKALDILREMQHQGIQPNLITYNTCMSACARQGKWQHALELLEEMKKSAAVEPDAITYNSCISALGKGKQLNQALDLLREMKTSGLRPDVITYNACISACKKSNDPEKALELLQAMKKTGVQPDVITYNACISACEMSRNLPRALDLLQDMKKSGIQPDVITYNACISVCAKSQNWEQALALVQEMPKSGVQPDLTTYNTCISACANSGQWKSALILLNGMKSIGLNPDIITYNTCMLACKKGGEYEHIINLFQDLENNALEPDELAYNECVRAFVKAGNWKSAVEMLENMKLKTSLSPLKAYQICITGYKANQERTLLEKLVEEFDKLNQVASPGISKSNCLDG